MTASPRLAADAQLDPSAGEPRPAAAHPSVSVVLPTRDRLPLLRRAVAAVLAQDYPGPVECVVVFDRSEPVELGLPTPPGRTVRTIRNGRTPGLAGARNSGWLAASGELVAFCDDDDEWLPTKLARQVRLLHEHPEAVVVSCGILVHARDRDVRRPAPSRPLTQRDLLRDRHMEIHPSTLLARRQPALERVGLVDEAIPGSYAEDYEWLLRAAAAGPLPSLSEPLVRVAWGRTSYFADQWRTIIAALGYLLDRYPQFATEPAGLARIEGQLAFAHAALGDRRGAGRWARRALRHNPRERRAYLALLVGLRLLPAGAVLRAVRAAGRGV